MSAALNLKANWRIYTELNCKEGEKKDRVAMIAPELATRI